MQAAPIPGHSPVGRWVGQHLSWEAKDSAGLALSPALGNPGGALALPGLHRGCGPATLRLSELGRWPPARVQTHPPQMGWGWWVSPSTRPRCQSRLDTGQVRGGGPSCTSTTLGRPRAIRNTWPGQPSVPTSLRPGLGPLTHRAEPGRDSPGLPAPTGPSAPGHALRAQSLPAPQLSVHASLALRLMPPHLALSTEGGPAKL